MKNKFVIPTSLLCIFVLFILEMSISSCTDQKGNITKICVLPDTVSFSKDVLPILNEQCSIPGCHTDADNAGDLNLDAVEAYSSLMRRGTGYVDTLNPDYSVMYSMLISKSDPMPPAGHARLSKCDIDLIYKWIVQKAKNN